MLKTYATQELIPFYTPKSPTKIREEPIYLLDNKDAKLLKRLN